MTSPVAITLASNQCAQKTGASRNSASAPPKFGQIDAADEALELFTRLDFSDIDLSGHSFGGQKLLIGDGPGRAGGAHLNCTIKHSGSTCHLVE
ncbi:hypothetical protein AB4Z51_37130 [Bradyrhizobium sp. 2TAF36]|uniref:hypothetical protein n=1 Tax=Bradyrhizobium sp. 2TAF36 TaxID=3233016 RepID=UPI003F8F811B